MSIIHVPLMEQSLRQPICLSIIQPTEEELKNQLKGQWLRRCCCRSSGPCPHRSRRWRWWGRDRKRRLPARRTRRSTAAHRDPHPARCWHCCRTPPQPHRWPGLGEREKDSAIMCVSPPQSHLLLIAKIHFLTQSCDPISHYRKLVEQTNETISRLVSLIHSTGLP